MSDLAVLVDYDCEADPSLTQLLSIPTMHDGLFMGDNSDTSTTEYNGVSSSAQLDHEGSLVTGQTDGYRIDLSTDRPKWRLDEPALSGLLLYSLVNHAYANRCHHHLVR